MDDVKTVGSVGTDLYAEQAKDVSEMRNALLSFNKKDPNAAKKAIQNVTILRVYHQMERIVKFTEMMDKLEDRVYQSIDAKLEDSDPDDSELYFTLIPIQERLQHMMIESHKLLEPYLSFDQLANFEVPVVDDPGQSFASMLLDQESREKVRTSAQEVLAAIASLDKSDVSNQPKEANTAIQDKASEVLAELDESDGDSN